VHDLAIEILYFSYEFDPATARGVAYKAMYLPIKRADIFIARLLGGHGGAPKPSRRGRSLALFGPCCEERAGV
jgi:hypothetical protein